MNCRRFEEMIPLYVEGDLEADRADRVSAHLKSCVACSRLAGGFSDSQEWLRSYTPPAFDATFFDSLRNGVLTRIEDEKARPSFFQLITASWRWDAALAAALLLVILSGVAIYTYQRGFKPAREQAVSTPPKSDETQAPPKRTESKDKEPQQIAEQPLRRRHRTIRESVAQAIGRAQLESMIDVPPDLGTPLSTDSDVENTAISQIDTGQGEPEVLVKTAPPTSEPLTRIEIQTGDPTVRIIWFAPTNVDKNSGRRSTDT